ncbi:MAG: hypothetical protein OXH11_18860 [Candidatus Aminicenantes bacterium]|nr:hypothetical protein [Candidatus Aminicenantes bacterium]
MLTTLPQIRISFNRSLSIETQPERLSTETGALLQQALLDRSGIIDWMSEWLHDPRNPDSRRCPDSWTPSAGKRTVRSCMRR